MNHIASECSLIHIASECSLILKDLLLAVASEPVDAEAVSDCDSNDNTSVSEQSGIEHQNLDNRIENIATETRMETKDKANPAESLISEFNLTFENSQIPNPTEDFIPHSVTFVETSPEIA